MTPVEWKTRCAAQYMKRRGLTHEQALSAAQTNFEAQEGPFSQSAHYNPEECADADMDSWPDTRVE